MITLEQIRLLESKITRALDLVRVLKEENSTLRKGLESAQKRMRELETLVDGLKTDQKEIESIIVRTLHNLDDLEETAATAGGIPAATAGGTQAASSAGGAPAASAAGVHGASAASAPAAASASPSGKRAESRMGTGPLTPAAAPQPVAAQNDAEPPSPKEELDIF
jgi:hypothetical protein